MTMDVEIVNVFLHFYGGTDNPKTKGALRMAEALRDYLLVKGTVGSVRLFGATPQCVRSGGMS